MVPRKKISIAVDGGDFALENRVQSGIQRLIHQFILEYHRGNFAIPLHYYYFSSEGKPIKIQSEGQLTLQKLPRRFFSSLRLPYTVFKNQNTVFLGFAGVIPQLLKYSSIKKVLFIHDFGFYKYPQYYNNPGGMKNNLESSVQKADLVITFSEYVRKEVLEVFPQLDETKVRRIYAGIDHLARLPLKFKSLGIIKSPYFLYVGVIKPVKNISGLLELFAAYRRESRDTQTKLVMVGTKEIRHWQEITNTPQYKKVKSGLIFLEDITDKDLTTLYTHARSLINISFEEGFCYPVLEALSCGTPVITNQLPLYLEFKPHYSQLHITSTLKERVLLMRKFATVPSVRKRSIPALFTWKHFTVSLYKLIEML